MKYLVLILAISVTLLSCVKQPSKIKKTVEQSLSGSKMKAKVDIKDQNKILSIALIQNENGEFIGNPNLVRVYFNRIIGDLFKSGLITMYDQVNIYTKIPGDSIFDSYDQKMIMDAYNVIHANENFNSASNYMMQNFSDSTLSLFDSFVQDTAMMAGMPCSPTFLDCIYKASTEYKDPISYDISLDCKCIKQVQIITAMAGLKTDFDRLKGLLTSMGMIVVDYDIVQAEFKRKYPVNK